MGIKFSILFPYFRRSGHLHNTLISFLHHYSHRNDYEVILAEDFKNRNDDHEHSELMKVVRRFEDKINIVLLTVQKETWNPCLAFNRAAEAASGDFYLVSNPECFHQVNILEALDKEFAEDPWVYVVCSCRNRVNCNFFIDAFDQLGGKDEAWYSHSVHRDGCLHFCNALSKECWEMVQGFDEDYQFGIAYDDNDFINRIRRVKLKIRKRDDLLTVHIGHGPAHVDAVIRRQLEIVNWKVFDRKWNR